MMRIPRKDQSGVTISRSTRERIRTLTRAKGWGVADCVDTACQLFLSLSDTLMLWARGDGMESAAIRAAYAKELRDMADRVEKGEDIKIVEAG